MKTPNTELRVVKPRRSVALDLMVFLALAATTSFAACVISTIDGGGQRATSASYTMDGSVGGIGGIATAGSQVARHGYPGQLTEATGLSVTGTPVEVNEASTSQLSGTAMLDDATVVTLAGADVNWSSAGVPYPLSSVNTAGVATATNVYQNAATLVNGYYLGATANTGLLVLDANPDDYGSYAGDGLPDWWQAQYFGLNNPNAAPTNDVTGTGQNNLFKYTAGLDPTNAASVFKLRIENVAGQPSQKKLTCLPWASGRTYTTEYRTNLVTGVYTNLTGYGGPTTNGTEVSITDVNAVERQKFYRIRISLP